MTRYTKYEGNRVAFADPYGEELGDHDLISVLLLRLSRYEDTGLTPSDIHAMVARMQSVERMTGATYAHITDLLQHENVAQPSRVSLTLAKVVDFELCAGTGELRDALQSINDHHYDVITVTQFGNTFIVFFRRPADG